jgi:Flp pilus assembly protein TadG
MSEDRPTEGSRRRARKLLARSRFIHDRSGSTAVEFSLLALPFALLVFAIFESCISFAAQEVLANATDDIARQVRTGQLRAADLDGTKLRDMVCERLEVVVTSGCPGLAVDLRTVDTFQQAASLGIPWNASRTDIVEDFEVDPGPTLSKNVLRVFYRWPIITNFMAKSMANLPDNNTLLFSMAAWQNEPF